jgi:hypothetical protein
VFLGGITGEQLDLMTLEQVRTWTRAKRQAEIRPLVETPAPSRATALHEITLAALDGPGRSPGVPEGEEVGEDEDFSWMDDMEALGAAAG